MVGHFDNSISAVSLVEYINIVSLPPFELVCTGTTINSICTGPGHNSIIAVPAVYCIFKTAGRDVVIIAKTVNFNRTTYFFNGIYSCCASNENGILNQSGNICTIKVGTI